MDNNKKKIYITKSGLEELKKELEELEKSKRPEVVQRVSAARAMGDLAENSEYAAAREELSIVDGRIEELSEIIKNAALIEEEKSSGKKTVKLGSKVTLSIGKKQETFTLVGEWEADPEAKKISHESPLGKALIGRVVGNKVEVEAPAGKVIYAILSLD